MNSLRSHLISLSLSLLLAFNFAFSAEIRNKFKDLSVSEQKASQTAQGKKNIEAFLTLRPSGYIDRFGAKTPDFDQYVDNVKALLDEHENKNK